MLSFKNRVSRKLLCKVLPIAVIPVILTACAQHKAPTSTVTPTQDHTRSRFDDQQSEPCPVPYGKTDWKAVVTALGGAGKKATNLTRQAGGYGQAVWSGTGGKLVDLAAGRIVTNPPGVCSRSGYAWPSHGKISRGFRPDENHKGLDITAKIGTPIYAARAGKVIYADNELSGFGNCIIIQHDPVWTTFYAHNNKNFVRAGDVVQAGQQIAEVGETGRATGPHLHFEIRQDGTALDPHPMLP